MATVDATAAAVVDIHCRREGGCNAEADSDRQTRAAIERWKSIMEMIDLRCVMVV